MGFAFSYFHIYENNWTAIARGYNSPLLIFFHRKIFTTKSTVGDFKHINSEFLCKIFPTLLFFLSAKKTDKQQTSISYLRADNSNCRRVSLFCHEYSLLLAAPRGTDGIDNKFMVGIFQTHYSYKIHALNGCDD